MRLRCVIYQACGELYKFSRISFIKVRIKMTTSFGLYILNMCNIKIKVMHIILET